MYHFDKKNSNFSPEGPREYVWGPRENVSPQSPARCGSRRAQHRLARIPLRHELQTETTFFLHLLWVEKFTCICHSTFSGKNFMCRLSWSISNHFGAIFLLKCASQAEIAKNSLRPPIQAQAGTF